MPFGPVNPDDLDGDELDAWYRRSPADIEQERQAAAQQAYNDFYGGEAPTDSGVDGDPTQVSSTATTSGSMAQSGLRAAAGGFDPEYVDTRNSGDDADAYLFLAGNPHNPPLKREWEQREGRPWPRDEYGRSYHVAHKKALTDGGTNTLDNIEPMHPDDHIAQHVANGDFARWAKQPWIARAFGGRVVRGVGVLSLLSAIGGIWSGRIRTDNYLNFGYDMMGYPSPEDEQRLEEEFNRRVYPNWKRGDPPVA